MPRYLLLLCCSACYLPLVVRATERGHVADDRTQAPIAGASVCIESWRVGGLPGPIVPVELEDAFQTKTDGQGNYEIPSKREWHMTLIFPDAGPAYFPRYLVGAPGYETRVIDTWRKPALYEGMAQPILLKRGESAAPKCPGAATTSELPPESQR
jgi:hypothetical protein